MKMEDITTKAIQASGHLEGVLKDMKVNLKPKDYTEVTLCIHIPHQKELFQDEKQ